MKNVNLNLKSTATKMATLLLVAMITLNFSACKKNDKGGEVTPQNYEAGNIPGLGKTEGDLTGTPFTLPNGVKLSGDITGSGYQDNYWDWSSIDQAPQYQFVNKNGEVEMRTHTMLRSANDSPVIHYYGSGYGFVDLLITLSNTSSSSITVTFPAGTILISASGECQNGILLQTVIITIPANSDYVICLGLYCGNLTKHAASNEDVYKFGVISDAQPLIDLCNLLKNKKIDISSFSPASNDDYNAYCDIVGELQNFVWMITDIGMALSDDNISYINSLPNK